MPNLASMGQKGPGTELSSTYLVPASWDGMRVEFVLNVPANQNTSNRSMELVLEHGPTASGPWTTYCSLNWQGGGTDPRWGTWEPSTAPVVPSWLVGQYVRGRMEIPVRIRCGLDIDEVTG